MARNVVKTQDYSFQGLKKEGMGYRTKALLLFVLCTLVNLQITAQYIAYAYDYHPYLGGHLLIKGYPIYPSIKALYWLYIQMSNYEESRSTIAAMGAFIFSAGLLLSVFAARKIILSGKSENLDSLHGSAHWATMREIKDAGLLDSDGHPFDEGIVVGGVKIGKEVKMMRHGGKEHVLCYAPTRSGKGISLVLPTLLDGWNQSVFVLDIKQENFALSAGYRAKELKHKILKLDFTDPDAIAKGTSATFNPLEEVVLDFDFAPGTTKLDPDDQEGSAFKLAPTGSYTETATIQQIVSVIVDPQGKGMEDHWSKTASSFMLGAINHLSIGTRSMGKALPESPTC